MIAWPSLEVLEVHSSGNGDERDQPHEIFFSGLQNGYADSLIVPGDWNRFSGAALVREESHCQVWVAGRTPPVALSHLFEIRGRAGFVNSHDSCLYQLKRTYELS